MLAAKIMIIIKEITPNYHYSPCYTDNNGKTTRNLGDIFFDREQQACKVRFYGWSRGISLADLTLVVAEIQTLEARLKATVF